MTYAVVPRSPRRSWQRLSGRPAVNVFELRDSLVGDCSDYMGSFIRIRDRRIQGGYRYFQSVETFREHVLRDVLVVDEAPAGGRPLNG